MKTLKQNRKRETGNAFRAAAIGLSLMVCGSMGCASTSSMKPVDHKKMTMEQRILWECNEGPARYVLPVIQSFDKVKIKGHIETDSNITPTRAFAADDVPTEVEESRKIVIVENKIGVCPKSQSSHLANKPLITDKSAIQVE